MAFGLDPVEIDKTWHAELPIEWLLESPNATGVVPDGVGLIDHATAARRTGAAAPPRTWTQPFAEFQKQRLDLLNGARGAPKARCGPAI